MVWAVVVQQDEFAVFIVCVVRKVFRKGLLDVLCSSFAGCRKYDGGLHAYDSSVLIPSLFGHLAYCQFHHAGFVQAAVLRDLLQQLMRGRG